MASHPDTKIDCSKVYVKRSSFATDDNDFDGAFAAVAMKKGACVQYLVHSWSVANAARSAAVGSFAIIYFSQTNPSPSAYDATTGDLVEKGVMRRLPDGFDGNTCPYIFTWSNERPNKVWGMGSGCSPFYNTVRRD